MKTIKHNQTNQKFFNEFKKERLETVNRDIRLLEELLEYAQRDKLELEAA